MCQLMYYYNFSNNGGMAVELLTRSAVRVAIWQAKLVCQHGSAVIVPYNTSCVIIGEVAAMA